MNFNIGFICFKFIKFVRVLLRSSHSIFKTNKYFQMEIKDDSYTEKVFEILSKISQRKKFPIESVVEFARLYRTRDIKLVSANKLKKNFIIIIKFFVYSVFYLLLSLPFFGAFVKAIILQYIYQIVKNILYNNHTDFLSSHIYTIVFLRVCHIISPINK